MDYSSLTERQIQKRYYSLPDNIRDVLESEKEIETIRKICREHHLVGEEKTLIVEQLAGLVLLGFISADDLGREISENIHLNRQHSGDIVSEISGRIFSPIKSDLEKIYSPAAVGEEEWGGGAEGVLDLRETETETREADRPDLSWEVVDLKKEDTPKIIETEKKVLASAASAGEEIIDLEKMDNATEISPAEPKTVETKPFDAAQDKLPVVSEVEPLIIHKETELKSVSGFDKKRSLGDLFGFLKKRPAGEIKTEKPPVVQIEIGQTEAEPFDATRGEPDLTAQGKPPVASPSMELRAGRSESPKIRVVHYGGLRTPISPFGKEAEATTEKKPETIEKIDAAKQETKVERIEIPAPIEKKIESFDTTQDRPQEIATKTEILTPPEQKAVQPGSPQEASEAGQKIEPEKPENKKPESDEEIIDLRSIS